MFNFYPIFPLFQKRIWKENASSKIDLTIWESEKNEVPYASYYNSELGRKFMNLDKNNEIYKYVLKEFEKYPRFDGECFAAAIAYLDSQKLIKEHFFFDKKDFKNYALAEYLVQYFQFKAFGYKYFSLFANYIYEKGCCCANDENTKILERIQSKVETFTGDDSIIKFFYEEEYKYKYNDKSLPDKFSENTVSTELIQLKCYCLFAKNLEEETELINKQEIRNLKETIEKLNDELEYERSSRQNLEFNNEKVHMEELICKAKSKIRNEHHFLLEFLLETQEQIIRLQHLENLDEQIFQLSKRRLEDDKRALDDKLSRDELQTLCEVKEKLTKLQINMEQI
ncbi:13736_t:CDS:1 [Funneliformis geosporum]|uniref:19909_t:CDS:1 n=1 Tax=Funneliformis geosporum TaxID=1117311 RepID=A0A9W4WLC5_9GLOM|nr:19909_t:CDS:1 [Funneliformis geosporum]CAI2176307.1 13736_t:CDS:1 [Funneliformis geosporum]